MIYDIQKASILKRVSAWLLDAILLSVLAVGCIWAISAVIGYDAQSEKLEAYYAQYEAEYQVDFDFIAYGYDALTDEQKLAYDAMMPEQQAAFNEEYTKTCEEAYNALFAVEDVVYTYNLVLQMTIMMICLGIFVAMLILDFLLPLWLRNGQTVGKKIFGLAVMRADGVRIQGVSLFIRAILGKYAVETMIPVFVITMWLVGIGGLGSAVVLLVLLVVQLAMVIFTSNHSAIHDKLADTVVVDMASQMIFETQAERLEYQQRIAAERAERQPY